MGNQFYKTLIVDGPDGAGKSTLLKQLFGDTHDRVVHALPTPEYKAKCRAEPEVYLKADKMFDHVCSEMVKAKGQGKLVFDRAWPSTIVYQQLNPDLLLDLPAVTLPCLVYLVMPSKDTLRENAIARGEGAVGLLDEWGMDDVYKRYLDLLNVHSIQGMTGIDVIVDTGPNPMMFAAAFELVVR